MTAPANAMWFRVNMVDGSLMPIEDVAAASSSPGDGMLAVTGVPSGTTPEQVRALLYAVCGPTFGWGALKLSVPYFNLVTPNVVPTGFINFTAQPVATNTITIGSSTWTFVASGATGNQTNIGANLAATLSALATNLNASADAQVSQNTYTASATQLAVTSKTAGTSKNGFVLATNVSGATASGTLTGGTTLIEPSAFTIP